MADIKRESFLKSIWNASRQNKQSFLALVAAGIPFGVSRCPLLSTALTFYLALALIAKFWAVAAGFAWIRWCGRKSLKSLRELDEHTRPWVALDREAKLCEFFSDQQTSLASQERPLFGLFDFRWRRSILKSKRRSRFFGCVSESFRNLTFRTEALLLMTATQLMVSSGRALTESFVQLPFFSLAVPSIVVVAMMALEILVGNVEMGQGYSRYCHFHVADGPTPGGRGWSKLNQIYNIGRFLVIVITLMGAVCQSYDHQLQGFHRPGAETSNQGPSPPKTFSEDVFEFQSFSWTTFTTVGYGDVYPEDIGSRILVIVLHVLSASLVLVLLQIVLNADDATDDMSKGTATKPDAPGRSSAQVLTE